MSADTEDPRDGRPRVSREGAGHRLLPTGTYLQIYCPHCGADLLEDRRVHVTMIGSNGQHGELHLSPRFNVFDKDSTIDLETGKEFGDLRCPRCEQSLIEREVRCEWCDSHAARFRISAVRLDFDLFICARIGCHWHGLTEEDRQRVSLDEPSARSDDGQETR